MRKLFTIFCLLSFSIAQGQTREMIKDLQGKGAIWNEGTLYLKNEEVLKGLVQYNDKNGTLSLKTHVGSESFSANTVSRFDFFDETLKVTRNFMSFDYPIEYLKSDKPASFSLTGNQSDAQFKKLIPTFFEVLKESNHFALLSMTKPIEYKKKVTSTYVPDHPIINNEKHIISQDEILFFLNNDGVLVPYLLVSNSEVDKRRYIELNPIKEEQQLQVGNVRRKKSEKNRIIDSDALKTLMGDSYSRVYGYIEANDLSTRDKDDLLKIVDFYISLKK